MTSLLDYISISRVTSQTSPMRHHATRDVCRPITRIPLAFDVLTSIRRSQELRAGGAGHSARVSQSIGAGAGEGGGREARVIGPDLD